MKKIECGGCGQRIWVKGLVDPCNPLCEFCRSVLETKTEKARPALVLPEPKIKIARCCDWCQGTSHVKHVRSYGKPLCEFCRSILSEENAKAKKNRYRARKKLPCICCGKSEGVGKIKDRPGYLCSQHRAERKREKQKKREKIYNQKYNAPERKALRAAKVVDHYCQVVLNEKDLTPVCVGCSSKEDVVAVRTKLGIKLFCADCRGNLYERPRRRKQRFADANENDAIASE
jgi:hypothetical protein